ncbi:PAS domain S-box protein, partial [Paraburkholderia bengalensis]
AAERHIVDEVTRVDLRAQRRKAVARLGGGGSTADEARMPGIIRSSMEATITIDEAHNIVVFNPAAERIFGVTAAQALGMPLARFIPPRFRDAHAQHVAQFGVTDVSQRQMGPQPVLCGLRANGEEFALEASISQTRESSGKLYTVMLRDVTARVKAEAALEQSREELRRLSANLQSVREEEKTRIADNGRGARRHPGAHEGDGQSSGLIGVRERAHRLGGAAQIDTAENNGFALNVTFSLQAVQQEHTHP